MLIRYLRKDNGQKYGVVVALGRDMVGWAAMHPTNEVKPFNQEFGLLVAQGRAVTAKYRDEKAQKVRKSLKSGVITKRQAKEMMPKRPHIPENVRVQLELMKARAKLYYKDKKKLVATETSILDELSIDAASGRKVIGKSTNG